MASIYAGAQKELTLVSGVTKKITFPFGSKEHLVQVTPNTDWEWSYDQDTLEADKGIQMTAGSVLTVDSPVVRTDVFIRQSSGSDKSLRWAYLYPNTR